MIRTLILCVLCISGCSLPMPNSQRHHVAEELRVRAGARPEINHGTTIGSVPPGLETADGISENEAVAIALWNNAALGELLAQLDVSRAQVYDAGLIADPQLVMFFPLGPKQLEFTVFQAADEIWLRPLRRRAAELDLCELSKTMIQNGLNTARDVRLAHADLVLAQDRERLTNEAHELREAIRQLAEKRLGAGDISELEATTTEIDSLTARASAANAKHDVALAQDRLRILLGVNLPVDSIRAERTPATMPELNDRESVVDTAWAMRPDLRAIDIRRTAAENRLQLAKKQFVQFESGFDANSDGEEGFEAGPALRMTLPIYNRNRGQIAIAQAALQQIDHQRDALRDQVQLDVLTALTQLEQAHEQLGLIDREILPALREAQRLSAKNYEDGGIPYFLVLQTTGQLVDAQLRRAAAEANTRRASAELERSVGMKLPRVPMEAQAATTAPPTLTTSKFTHLKPEFLDVIR